MLKNLICYFCLFVTLACYAHEDEPVLSSPDQLASLRSGDLIGGLVSPLGGDPVLRQTDLVVRGAQEIPLSRVYIPPAI